MHPDSANAYPSGNTASIWMGTFDTPDFAPLPRDLTTDVCVIGAGIAGLTTAYSLLKAGKKVIVIDDGPIGGGESGRPIAQVSWAVVRPDSPPPIGPSSMTMTFLPASPCAFGGSPPAIATRVRLPLSATRYPSIE